MTEYEATSLRPSTMAWVNRHLEVGEEVVGTGPLHGGIVAEVQKLTIGQGGEINRHLVLKSYVGPLALRHAEDWLHREAGALKLLVGCDFPTPELVAVDPTAAHCECPSLLMTYLPGRPVFVDSGVTTRVPLLARQLVAIHALRSDVRPREYQALTTTDTVVIPARVDAEVWAAALDVIRGPAPLFEGRILHRDFQPGNVLFDASTAESAHARISGVVDWAGTSWGPADLDVAHCSTNLALLHGPEWGPRFAAAYEEAGGALAATASDRRYWRVRDALACSEEVQSWAGPWREAGRADLTARVVEERLDAYLSLVMSVGSSSGEGPVRGVDSA